MRPDFSKINLGFGGDGDARAGGDVARESPEKIDIKTFYVRGDLADSEHLGFVSGIPPYLRGTLPDHVRHETLDHQAVRGIFHRGGIKRLLQEKPGRGAEGTFNSLRSSDSQGIRLGSPQGFGRRRKGGAWR